MIAPKHIAKRTHNGSLLSLFASAVGPLIVGCGLGVVGAGIGLVVAISLGVLLAMMAGEMDVCKDVGGGDMTGEDSGVFVEDGD